MKVKEVVERDCCDPRKNDFRFLEETYSGTRYYCRWCGQVYVEDNEYYHIVNSKVEPKNFLMEIQ